MPFNSAVFLFIFFPAVLLAYFAAGRRLRNAVLLLASWVFYVWGEPVFFPILAAITVLSYVFGRWIGKRQSADQNSRPVVLLAVVALLAPLVFFKYSFFVASNLHRLLLPLHFALPRELLAGARMINDNLPLGISFYTFQALSYVLDIYRKANPPENNFYKVILYLSLFPELISGPLVRFRELSKQFAERSVTAADFAEGARRFIFGLSKKVLIVGTLEKLHFAILNSPGEGLTPAVAWLYLISYALRIYFDFSGYSDMAIGAARIFGFRLPENFNYPYISQSITEFWRRWHISLSNWFRDYVYFPLERSHRKSIFDRYSNILIVFLLTGLWHGANWNFTLWGLAQGAFIVFERSRFGAWLETAWRPVRHVYALFAILFSWVLFSFASVETGINFYRSLIGLGLGDPVGYPAMFLEPETLLVLAVALLFCLPVYPAIERFVQNRMEQSGGKTSLSALQYAFTNGAALLLLAVSIIYLAGSTVSAFIYFRF